MPTSNTLRLQGKLRDLPAIEPLSERRQFWAVKRCARWLRSRSRWRVTMNDGSVFDVSGRAPALDPLTASRIHMESKSTLYVPDERLSQKPPGHIALMKHSLGGS